MSCILSWSSVGKLIDGEVELFRLGNQLVYRSMGQWSCRQGGVARSWMVTLHLDLIFGGRGSANGAVGTWDGSVMVLASQRHAH